MVYRVVCERLLRQLMEMEKCWCTWQHECLSLQYVIKSLDYISVKALYFLCKHCQMCQGRSRWRSLLKIEYDHLWLLKEIIWEMCASIQFVNLQNSHVNSESWSYITLFWLRQLRNYNSIYNDIISVVLYIISTKII